MYQLTNCSQEAQIFSDTNPEKSTHVTRMYYYLVQIVRTFIHLHRLIFTKEHQLFEIHPGITLEHKRDKNLGPDNFQFDKILKNL